jgi:hypothetical protein
MTVLFIVILILAILLLVGTMVISFLKNLQKTRYPHWTFLDYISVGYARHLYLKYILRK